MGKEIIGNQKGMGYPSGISRFTNTIPFRDMAGKSKSRVNPYLPGYYTVVYRGLI